MSLLTAAGAEGLISAALKAAAIACASTSTGLENTCDGIMLFAEGAFLLDLVLDMLKRRAVPPNA